MKKFDIEYDRFYYPDYYIISNIILNIKDLKEFFYITNII